jgi:hypothetical protein
MHYQLLGVQRHTMTISGLSRVSTRACLRAVKVVAQEILPPVRTANII